MKKTILSLLTIALLASCTGNKKKSDSNTTTEKNNIKTEKKMEIATQNKASVKAFFKALEAENANAVADLFAENAKHINPYHSNLFPKGAEGKEGIKAYWQPVFPNFDGMTFPIEELYAMENPNIVFVKYKGNIKLKNGAGVYSNDYYSTFKFDDNGKIVEYVEIFNPITAARGFGLLDKIK